MRARTRLPGRLFEPLEVRRLLAFALNVNFQPASAAVPAGYLADTGATYANRGNGYSYGWNAGASTFTRDRNASNSPDQRYDTMIHMQLYGARTWEAAVPNGTYSVHIVAGDPGYTDSKMAITAEGNVIVSGALSNANHFLDATKTVTVSDGKLTIGNGAGAVNDKLCFIQITSSSTTPPPTPTVSIAATDPSASEIGPDTGTFQVTRTGDTSAALTVKYGIGGSATNGTDYDSLSGSVTIAAGASFANITIKPHTDALVEGSESVTLTLAAAPGITLGTSSATVNIADGTSQPVGDASWPTTWTAGATLAKPRQEGRGGAMDGSVWIFGGFMSAATTGTQEVDYFNVASGTWSRLKNYGPMPDTHAAVAPDYANHAFYFLGGLYGNFPGTATNRVFKFDTLTQTWSELPPMPDNHEGGGAALINGELHYFGGSEDDRVTDSPEHLVLNLNNLAAGWQSAPAMPNPRAHFSTVVLGGKIYAIGGQFHHEAHTGQVALVDRYDPVSKTWEHLADLPLAVSHTETSTFVMNGKIVVAGGQINRFDSSDRVMMYDPASDAWSTIGTLPTPLQSGAVQLVGNQIVVATGNPGNNAINGKTFIGNLS